MDTRNISLSATHAKKLNPLGSFSDLNFAFTRPHTAHSLRDAG